MKSKTIEVSGVNLKCYEDGSVERFNNKTKSVVRGMGTKTSSGYRRIFISGRTHYCHRLMFKAFTGPLGSKEVDHINGDKSDNRPENLRLVNHQQNGRGFCGKKAGCTSKYRGVSFYTKKWWAGVCSGGKTHHLGSFASEKEAAFAYNNKAVELGFSLEALNDIK